MVNLEFTIHFIYQGVGAGVFGGRGMLVGAILGKEKVIFVKSILFLWKIKYCKERWVTVTQIQLNPLLIITF